MAASTLSVMSDSISSLSSSSHATPSVSRTYKQASQLFLTRQLAEAWQTLRPLTVASEQEGGSSPPPIASASKTARVKVWSLWIALVHEVLELGHEEGAKLMDNVIISDNKSGSRRWKDLSKSVKDCAIWDDVVNAGYSGFEAAVDAEVIANLATLLLSHATSQKLTQSKLESYLAATSSQPTAAQLASQLESTRDSEPGVNTHHMQNGTSTPRDLGSRQKLLEIYALHILPRNEQWDYARDFINENDLLDDERREAFLAALGSLREESSLQSRREQELQRQREEEERRAEAARAEELEKLRRQTPPMLPNGSAKVPVKRIPPPPNTNAAKSSLKKPAAGIPARRPPQPSNILQRASLVVATLQRAFLQMGHSLTRNPLSIIRMLLFFVAMVLALGRNDVRGRLGAAWDKVKSTIGMGVQVRY